MEGFLSLEQAAQQLDFSVSELTRQIEEGRVVAIVREGNPWLSTGEVMRLKRQSEKSGETSKEMPTPLTGSRLHRAAQPESQPNPSDPKPVVAAAPLEPVPSSPLEVPASATSAASSGGEEGEVAQRKIRELNKRCTELEARGQELESTVTRLKTGLAETEATLKRNRTARGNLENEVIGLQDQLNKARARSEALEREVQHLGAELERVEEVHAGELRRLRSGKERAPDPREAVPAPSTASAPELEEMRQRMLEKDRLLTQEYEQRAALRSQLEDIQQKYFELKALYDKEKTDWSEVLAKSVQNQNLLREQIEELKAKNPKGWNPFRREK